MPKASAEDVNKKEWKGSNVEIGPQNEWRGGSVAEWKKEEEVPQKGKRSSESGEDSDCKEEGKALGEGNHEETERMREPPKGRRVVLPAGADGEGGREGRRKEGSKKGKGGGGGDRSEKGKKEGGERGEKECEATNSQGSEVGDDDGKAFNPKRESWCARRGE